MPKNRKIDQIAPTLARGNFKPEMYKDPNWFAEEKYDGDRRVAQFIAGRVHFTGRRIGVDGTYVEKTDNLPHLNWYDDEALNGTIVDGELICTWEGARSKDVTSIMGSLPEKAIEKQTERGWLRYVLFDCLKFGSQDLTDKPLAYRRKFLQKVINRWEKYEHTGKSRRVDSVRAEKFFNEIVAKGGEGIILKDARSTYSEDKKWVKVKKTDTHDVVVIGYEDAKAESTKVSGKTSATKYHEKGWIGAVRFGQYVPYTKSEYVKKFGTDELPTSGIFRKNGNIYVLTDCGKCSGMTDALRKKLSENKRKYIGRVVEIKANEREPTGKFRHPRWVGFRKDKPEYECVYEVERK